MSDDRQQQFEQDKENFLREVSAIRQKVLELEQQLGSGQINSALLLEVKEELEALEAVYGHRGNIGPQFKLFKSEAECNELFQPIMERLYNLFPRTDTTSLHAKLDAFLAKPKVIKFVRALTTSTHSRSENLKEFKELIQDEPGFSGNIVSFGNNINFELTVDGQRFILAVKKKSDVNQRAVYELGQKSETAPFFTPIVAQRKYLSVSAENESDKFDTVSIVPYLPNRDIFFYGEGLSQTERPTVGLPLFHNMAAMMLTLLESGAVMTDMKGTNLLVGENDTLNIADQKTMIYLEDLKKLQDVPSCSRLFRPEDYDLTKFLGDGAKAYAESFMAHLLGLNLAIFLLGYTEESLNVLIANKEFPGNAIGLKTFLLNKLQQNDDPLSILARNLLQKQSNLEEAYTFLTRMDQTIPATFLQPMNVALIPETVKEDPFVETILRKCFKPLEELRLKQEIRRDDARPGGRRYDLAVAKIAVIDRMIAKMREPVEAYKQSTKNDAAKITCQENLVRSIEDSLKTVAHEDTADYKTLKRCSNKIVDYLIRGLITISGALAVVGLFGSYKEFGRRTESHKVVHGVRGAAKDIPTKKLTIENDENTKPFFGSPHRH